MPFPAGRSRQNPHPGCAAWPGASPLPSPGKGGCSDLRCQVAEAERGHFCLPGSTASAVTAPGSGR